MTYILYIFRFLKGHIRISGSPYNILKLANILSEYNIPISKLKTEKSTAYIYTDIKYRKILNRIYRIYLKNTEMKICGLPKLFILYKKRTGILIGIILGLAALIISNQFIWSIDVVGNEIIPEQEILSYVEKQGLKVGVLKKSVDIHMIAIEAELEIKELSWLAVNINGTKAVIEVREAIKKPEITDYLTPTNLVASCDGVVLYAEAISGINKVKRNEVVTKGQLLISGTVYDKNNNYKQVRSIGKVIARTYHRFEKKINCEITEKIYTGKNKTFTVYKIFGLKIPIGKNMCNYKNYDTTETTENITLFSKIILPIEKSKISYKEYINKQVTIEKEKAIKYARNEIEEEISIELANAEILSKREETGKNSISIAIECIEDICSEVLIDLSEK